MPVKVTTAPMSWRARVSAAASAAASKSSRCNRIAMTRSSTRHGREEGDFPCARERRLGAHVAAVERGADHLRILECVGVFLAASGKPRHQVADRGDAGGKLDLLLGLADP